MSYEVLCSIFSIHSISFESFLAPLTKCVGVYIYQQFSLLLWKQTGVWSIECEQVKQPSTITSNSIRIGVKFGYKFFKLKCLFDIYHETILKTIQNQ